MEREPLHHAKGDEKETFLLTDKDLQNAKETTVIDVNPLPNGHGEEKTDKADDEKEDDDWFEDDDDDDDDDNRNILATVVLGIQHAVTTIYSKLTKLTRGFLIKGIILLAFFAYVLRAITYKHEGEDFWRLICCTILGIFMAIRFKLASLIKMLAVRIYGSDKLSMRARHRLTVVRFFVRWFMYAAMGAIMFYILYSEGQKSLTKLRSIPGLCIVLLICLLLSCNPQKINWHTIYMSIALQFVCAVLFLKWSVGQEILIWIQSRLDEFFANSKSGSVFLFGESYEDHYLVFGALPVVLIMGSTMAILYYLGAMQLVVKGIGSVLSFLMDTGPIESTSVAAGIFMEGMLAIVSLKPFLPGLTKSEMFVVMTSSFSSLGGAYLGLLMNMGIPLEHLFPAMMISAPATFTVCKLIFPETKRKKKAQKDIDFELEESKNLLEALQNGAVSVLPLLTNVISIMFVFMACISWIDHTLEWFGERVGGRGFSMSYIFSYLLYPISLIMGIDTPDCRPAAELWGLRITSSNIIAFIKLVKMRGNRALYEAYLLQTNFTGPISYNGDFMVLEAWNTTLNTTIMSARSEAIVSYSLCGFSSILSVGITIGVFYVLIPIRRRWISTVPLYALIAGNIANIMSGCFASFFY